MAGQITRRTLLVSALLLGQLVCFLSALLWFGAWLERGLAARMLSEDVDPAARREVMAFIEEVRSIGTIVVVAVVVISALVAAVIVRRYESRLSQINRGLESQVAHRSAALLRSRDAVIFGLAKLAESRDGETGEHLERIARYTEVLARQISRMQTPGGDEDWVQTLASTAVLHDIGKVGIPDAVLRKPSSLTDEERATIEKHPFIGGDTLMEIKRRWGEDPFLVTASQVCFGHHEKWDGTGYPFGLKGEHIPMAARIVALADVYDALTSERAYKDAMSHDRAKQMITDASGTQFDPMVVQAFIEVADEFSRIARRIKVTGNGRGDRADGPISGPGRLANSPESP